MDNLKIIISSVRPGRKGPVVTDWIAEKARHHGSFNVEVLDLKEINLPLMDEPNHPSMKKMNMNIPDNGVPKLKKPMHLFL